MKKLLILISLISFNTQAEMPKYLEGATVTVTLKNGKTYEYKSEKMAVVPRDGLGFYKEASEAHAQAFNSIHNKVISGELVKEKKNRVYGLMGYGQTGGLNVSTDGSHYKVEHEKGAVGGFGYQRKVGDDVNLGVQVQSNETTSFSLGLDF